MIITLIIALFLVVCIIALFNRGISLRNFVREAFSTMDVYLKKRWDLVPNLVECVKGYAIHEKDVLERVTQLRNINYSNLTNEQKMEANKQIGFGLSKLIAIAENYPDLKANESFKNLMNELSNIENDIANARKYYNATVRELNNFTQMFPSNIICSIFGIREEKMFEIDETSRGTVKVEL